MKNDMVVQETLSLATLKLEGAKYFII